MSIFFQCVFFYTLFPPQSHWFSVSIFFFRFQCSFFQCQVTVRVLAWRWECLRGGARDAWTRLKVIRGSGSRRPGRVYRFSNPVQLKPRPLLPTSVVRKPRRLLSAGNRAHLVIRNMTATVAWKIVIWGIQQHNGLTALEDQWVIRL